MNDEESPVYGEGDNSSCDALLLGRPRSLITACIFSRQETASNTERVRGTGITNRGVGGCCLRWVLRSPEDLGRSPERVAVGHEYRTFAFTE